MDSEEAETSHDKGRASKQVVWNDLPLPDHETVIRDISCLGSIGLALQEALVNASTEQGDDGDTDTDSANQRIELDPPAVSQILESFGNAVAQTQREQRDTLIGRKQQAGSRSAGRSVGAPAAVLRGRVDHFNRRGAKWRFMVHDAQIIERSPLDKNRRKNERRSLWEVMKEKRPQPITIRRLEVLAYNDIE
jgi:hypothetical protein